METALKINNITKKYGQRTVLNGVSFETYPGEVFGLLGPNGAGKTTLIKLITGLINIESGEIEIFGKSLNKDYENAMNYLGAIVENPEMYKYMTGMQNIRQYARMRKNVTQERIDEVVHLVGLTNRINEKVSKYSLGMRQRLGVALALLHKPKLLILDEPTNGLDPMGIKNLRDILIDISHKEGICVLVSSHLMSEMELMCDRVAIINEGNVIKLDTIENLLSLSNGDKISYSYTTSDNEKAKQLFCENETIEVTDKDEEICVSVPIDNHLEIIASLTASLINNNVSVYTVTRIDNQNLEEAFINITKTGGDQIA